MAYLDIVKADIKDRLKKRGPSRHGTSGHDYTVIQNGVILDPLHDLDVDKAARLLQDLGQLQENWERERNVPYAT